MTLRTIAKLLGCCWFAGSAYAADISFVTGFYQSEKTKVDGNDGGGKSTLSLGGRFSNPLAEDYYWFAEGLMAQRSYNAADNQKAPDDSTSFSVMGGVRWYFFRFSDSIVPFLSAKGGYKSEKDADTSRNIQTETNGLYYYGSAGFRIWASERIFIELESNLFESALFGTKKSKAIDDSDAGAPVKTETTKSELFVSSYNGIESFLFGIGMKL